MIKIQQININLSAICILYYLTPMYISMIYIILFLHIHSENINAYFQKTVCKTTIPEKAQQTIKLSILMLIKINT